jgi:hypothetical protein
MLPFLLALSLLTASPRDQNPQLTFVLRGPAVLEHSEPLVLQFGIQNSGDESVYVKKPWKWASNAMYVEAISATGKKFSSPTALFDIRADQACTYFIPLHPGDETWFSQEFDAEPLKWKLPPGHYELRWVYDPIHYDRDDQCLVTGWPLWRQRAVSNPVSLEVK